MSALPPGYKQTDVGVIPQEWSTPKIGEIGEVLGGRQLSPNRLGELTHYLRVANIFDGWIDALDVLSMPFTSSEKQRFLLRKGDILLNEGQSLDLVGRSAIYEGDPPDCCFQNTLIRFRASPKAHGPYCQLVFSQFVRTGVFSKIALQTTSIAHLGTSRFASLQLALPPLPEQKAIAAALGDADGLITALEALIAKKRYVKQGAMQELLTGQRRLPGFRGEWRRQSVGSIFDFAHSTPLSRGQLSEAGEVKYIHYGDIHTRLHTHLDFKTTPMPSAPKHLCTAATRLRIGDWVFADASEDYDGVAKAIEIIGLPVDKEAVAGLHTFLMRERTPTFAPGFKGYLAYEPAFRAQIVRAATGTKVFGISKTQMKQIELHFPPLPDEQGAVAAVLSDMDAEIAALEGKLAKARALKQGMMQVLLTGEVRLV